jgi:mono/diheme cytochrome c family protein
MSDTTWHHERRRNSASASWPRISRAACWVTVLAAFSSFADEPSFHHAPTSAMGTDNPYHGQSAAADAGRQLYASRCAACHGRAGEGTGNIPALAHGPAQTASEGAIFWFITKGSDSGAMPSWAALPEEQRWQLVTFLKTLPTEAAPVAAPAASAAPRIQAPPPQKPFTDFRYEAPGTLRKITVNDLPAPFATASAGNAPSIVARPPGAWPRAPAGFTVGLFAEALGGPRVIRAAPNGDVFVAESNAGRIRVFRGIDANGKPERSEVFAGALTQPYGIAFYPPGPSPEWVYVGDSDAILRFAYQNGDLHAHGSAQHVADLPAGGHWTRDIAFSENGKVLFAAVGSESNVDDPDTNAAEKDRADILAFDPDGSHKRTYASGIRNP